MLDRTLFRARPSLRRDILGYMEDNARISLTTTRRLFIAGADSDRVDSTIRLIIKRF